MSREGDWLNISLVLYICELIARDSTEELERLGLDREAVAFIETLTVIDLVRLHASTGDQLIEFDPTRLMRRIRRQNNERESRTLLLRFVEAGATRKLTNQYFGTGNNEFARLRRRLGCPKNEPARNTKPDQGEVARVRTALHRLEPCNPTSFCPEGYLAIHQVTGLPIWIIQKALEQLGVETPGIVEQERGGKPTGS